MLQVEPLNRARISTPSSTQNFMFVSVTIREHGTARFCNWGRRRYRSSVIGSRLCHPEDVSIRLTWQSCKMPKFVRRHSFTRTLSVLGRSAQESSIEIKPCSPRRWSRTQAIDVEFQLCPKIPYASSFCGVQPNEAISLPPFRESE